MENENREMKESEKMTEETRAGEKNAGEESLCLEEKDVREKDGLRENATEIGGGKTSVKAENSEETTDWKNGLKTTEEFLAELRQAEKDAKEKARAARKAAKGAKKTRKAENKKKPFADDGHTVAEMNVEGMPFYEPNMPTKEQKKNAEKPTKKELFSMIMGAYRAYLPTLLFMVGIFTLVFLAAYFFLKSKY